MYRKSGLINNAITIHVPLQIIINMSYRLDTMQNKAIHTYNRFMINATIARYTIILVD